MAPKGQLNSFRLNFGQIFTLDSSKESLPSEYKFRRSMPYINCTEQSSVKAYVDFIGFTCAICYAVLIPVFMIYLHRKLHLALRASKMLMAVAARQDDLKVSLHEVQGATSERVQREDKGCCECRAIGF